MIDLPYPQTISSFAGMTSQSAFTGQVKSDGLRLAIVYGENCTPKYGVTKGGHETFAPTGVPDMAPGTVLDGELIGDGTWQGAQSAFSSQDIAAGWVCFDILTDPLGVVADKDAADHYARVRFLKQRGFLVPRTGPVEQIWDLVLAEKLEGMVVRARRGSGIWKMKRAQELDVLVHRGKAFLVDGRLQHLLGSLPKQPDGLVRVACEGKTSNGKLRAMRVIGPPLGQLASIAQLEGIRA